MEEGYGERRLAGFRQFLNGFVGDKNSPLFAEDPIQFRGSIIGSFRLPSSDVPAEILDWVLLFLYQRKCPHELAWLLAREVQSRMEALLPTIVPPVTNGGSIDTDSPDEGPYLLDSSLLHAEMLSQLQQVCSQLHNSDAEMLRRSSSCRPPQYQVSLVALKNIRRKMEDRHIVIQDLNALCGLVDGPPQSYYAVFDGHSGVEAASFCTAHLHWNLVQHPKFECDPEEALREAFATTEEAFQERSQREGIKSGCTAICCLIRDKNFYLAWLGDSQAILVKKGMPITVMCPHKPDRQDEKERVERAGGCVMHVGTWRVNGILAVSRALGDFEHKPCVSSEPDIINMPLDGDEDFLVLACDGLWDTLTPNDVTAAVYHYINQDNTDIDEIAAQVAQQAINRGSTDNVTVIIVFLRDLQTLAAQSAVTSFSTESVVNCKTNNGDEVDNGIPQGVFIDSKNVFENGDGAYNYKISGDIFSDGPEESYRPNVGLMPEATSISELPTPPIEDLMAEEDAQLRSQANPFECQEKSEAHDSHAKEIASAILNSALESVAHRETESDALQAFSPDSAFFSGQEVMSSPLEVVAECDNQISPPKPWVLQVEHSIQPDLVDYLPSEGQDVVPESPGHRFSDYYAHKNDGLDPFASYGEYRSEENRASQPDLVDQMQSEVLVVDQVQPDVVDQTQSEVSLVDQVQPKMFDQMQHEVSAVDQLQPNVVEISKEHVDFGVHDLQAEHMVENEAGHGFVFGNVPMNPFELETAPTVIDEHVQIQESHSEMTSHVASLEDQPSREHEPVPTPADQSLPDFASQFGFQSHTADADPAYHQASIEQVENVPEAFSDQKEQELMSNPFGNFEAQNVEVSHEQSNQNNYLDQFESLNSASQQDFNPFGQVSQEANLFGFAEETPSTFRPLQGVPEMIGISEAVPGIQTSEPLVASEHHMTSQKEVLAAFENILVPSSPDQPPATTFGELLQPSDVFLQDDFTQEMEVPETPERVSNLLASAPSPPSDIPVSPSSTFEAAITLTYTTPVTEGASYMASVPVQNSLLVDFIAPQMVVPELGDAEAVASLLASDVPPTPEVVLEKIPDGVPEADGVTEDSDSEKDGGWSYISGKGKDPATAGTVRKKTKALAASATSATVKRTSSATKDQVKSSPVPKSTKPTESKVKPVKPATTTAAPSKSAPKPTTLTSTIKKAPTESAKKPATSTTTRPKTTTTSTLGRSATGSTPKPAVSSTTNGTIAKSKETEAKAAKPSTLSRPASSTLTKRPAQPAKPAAASTVTSKVGASSTTAPKAGTLKPSKPPAQSSATARPASSTLVRPTTKPTTTRPATSTTTSTRKPLATSSSTKPPTTKVAAARPASKTTTTSSTTRSTESKLTKNTVNKQIVGQTGTMKPKPASTTTTMSNRTSTTTTKSSTLNKTISKTLKSSATSTKSVTKQENEASKTPKEEPTKSEPEKGSLEDQGKDNHAVDSGLASPESPVSPQLLMNGNHQVDAPIEENTTLVEQQAELN